MEDSQAIMTLIGIHFIFSVTVFIVLNKLRKSRNSGSSEAPQGMHSFKA